MVAVALPAAGVAARGGRAQPAGGLRGRRKRGPLKDACVFLAHFAAAAGARGCSAPVPQPGCCTRIFMRLQLSAGPEVRGSQSSRRPEDIPGGMGAIRAPAILWGAASVLLVVSVAGDVCGEPPPRLLRARRACSRQGARLRAGTVGRARRAPAR